MENELEKYILLDNYRLNNGNCTFKNVDSESSIVRIAVDIFYLFGGFLTLFGIILNFLCIVVVRKSKIYSNTCYGLYLRFICFCDILKLFFEYKFRILVMLLSNALHRRNFAHALTSLNALSNQTTTGSGTGTGTTQKFNYYFDEQLTVGNNFTRRIVDYNDSYGIEYFILKVLHCNLRLGFIMITENLSYIYCIYLAADRCFRISNSNWAKRHLNYKLVKRLLFSTIVLVLIYCSPHFLPVKHCTYIIYPNGYLTNLYYSDCMVGSSPFEFYWLNIESVVNTYVLPIILVILNIFLSIFIACKFKRAKEIKNQRQSSSSNQQTKCNNNNNNEFDENNNNFVVTDLTKIATKKNSEHDASETTSLNLAKAKPRKSQVKLKRRKEIIRATKEASFLVLGDTLLFVIVITPVNAFTYFYKDYDRQTKNSKMAYSLMGLTFSLINHSFNGIVYLICSKTFRIEFRQILKRLFKNAIHRRRRSSSSASIGSNMTANSSQKNKNYLDFYPSSRMSRSNCFYDDNQYLSESNNNLNLMNMSQTSIQKAAIVSSPIKENLERTSSLNSLHTRNEFKHCRSKSLAFDLENNKIYLFDKKKVSYPGINYEPSKLKPP